MKTETEKEKKLSFAINKLKNLKLQNQPYYHGKL